MPTRSFHPRFLGPRNITDVRAPVLGKSTGGMRCPLCGPVHSRSVKGMVRPCSRLTSKRCWKGRVSNGAPPCPTNQSRPLPPWASILARGVPRHRARSTRRGRAAAEVVTRPDRSADCQQAAVLIGMEAGVGAHHLSRKLQAHGHDPRLMPAKYVPTYSKGQKNVSAMPRRSPKRWSARR